MVRGVILFACYWTHADASFGPARACMPVSESHQIDVINKTLEICKSKMSAMNLDITLDTIETLLREDIAKKRWLSIDDAIESIYTMLDTYQSPLPPSTATSDPADLVLTVTGAALTALGTAQPELTPVTAAGGFVVAVMKAVLADQKDRFEKAREADKRSPNDSWKDVLGRWKSTASEVKNNWLTAIADGMLDLRKDKANNANTDLSEAYCLAWEQIQKAPTPRFWFNGYYALIFDWVHPPASSGRTFQAPSSNANYFVHATRDGKLFFQGIIFTPQPGSDNSQHACNNVLEVLTTRNGGCWNPSTPGLQSTPALQSDHDAVASAVEREKVGDFKVLVSADENGLLFVQYDCKDITDSKYSADAVIDHYEGCYNAEPCRDSTPAVVMRPSPLSPDFLTYNAHCENRFASRTDKIMGCRAYSGCDQELGSCQSLYMAHEATRQHVLNGLKGAIDFCMRKNYIKPQPGNTLAMYPVAAVRWHETSLCEECKGQTLWKVFTDHTCTLVGPEFKTQETTPSDHCQPVPDTQNLPWCDQIKEGSSEYCWGACAWTESCYLYTDGRSSYEQVGNGECSHVCSGFSGTLGKKTQLCKWPWAAKPAFLSLSNAESASEQAGDSCTLNFEPYVQCSADGDECWLSGDEVSGDGLMLSNGMSTLLSYDLSGVQLACVNPPAGVENACSIQLHEGTSCSSDIGPTLKALSGVAMSNLYQPILSDAAGLIDFPVQPSAATGKTVVIHSYDGSPMACAEIMPSCLSTAASTKATTGAPTTTTTELPAASTKATTSGAPPTGGYTPERCQACATMCSPCQVCRDSKSAECEKCWQCWDYDNDEPDDDDEIQCFVFGSHHDWDDEKVQCLSDMRDDCRLCWQLQLI